MKLNFTGEKASRSKLNKYRISLAPGLGPAIYQEKTLGFISAPTKNKAIIQASKLFPEYPWNRLIARTKTEIGATWRTEEEMFFNLPNVCLFPECNNKLHSGNKTGFCKEHREMAPERKQRNKNRRQ